MGLTGYKSLLKLLKLLPFHLPLFLGDSHLSIRQLRWLQHFSPFHPLLWQYFFLPHVKKRVCCFNFKTKTYLYVLEMQMLCIPFIYALCCDTWSCHGLCCAMCNNSTSWLSSTKDSTTFSNFSLVLDSLVKYLTNTND